MTHLDLSWNDLGIEGGKAILEGMQAGSVWVFLRFCLVSPK